MGTCLAGLSGFPSEVHMVPTLETGESMGRAAEPLLEISDHRAPEKHQEARGLRLLCWYF